MFRKQSPAAHDHALHPHEAVPLTGSLRVCEFCGHLHVAMCPRIAEATFTWLPNQEGELRRYMTGVKFAADVSHELWHSVAEVAEPEG